MKNILIALQGKKTYITSVAGLIFAITGLITGNLDQAQAVQVILIALGFSGVRNAIK